MSLLKTLNALRRLRQITQVLLKEELGHVLGKIKLGNGKKRSASSSSGPEPLQVRLRKVAENLGGTFIKFGQLLSMRYDVLPAEFCDEFEKLQDNVPAAPFPPMKKLIETELGKKLEEIFSEFNTTPIAAASIGQVYRAKLKTGEDVAVKVQRPGMDLLFNMDIELMKYLAKKIEQHYPETEQFNLLGLIETFEEYTRKELDFTMEAKNIEEFHQLFKNDKHVVIPRVFWEHTKKKVIVMSYVDGKRFRDIKDFKAMKCSQKKIVERVIEAEVKQIFDDGLFHADPHTGNIFVLPENRIAFLDFGIVGRLTEEMIEHVEDLLYGLVMNDADAVVKALLESGSVNDGIDEKALKADIHDLLGNYRDTSLEQINMKEFFLNLIRLAKKHNIRLPLNFSLLAKAFVTLEGFASKFDPDFNFVKFMEPRVVKIMKERTEPEYLFHKVKEKALELKDFLIAFPTELRSTLKALRHGQNTTLEIKELQKFTLELDRSSNRVTFGLILAALIVATALLIQTHAGPSINNIPAIAYPPIIFILLISCSLIVSIIREGREVKK